MPMPLAGNQIALGDDLYFFTSPRGAGQRCLIYGHAGHFHGDGTFDLGVNLTLHFLAEESKRLLSSPGLAIRGQGHEGKSSLAYGDAAAETVIGPSKVKNYRVRKGVGSQWKGEFFSYHDVQSAMNEVMQQNFAVWCPNVVTVRRRWNSPGHKTVLLSEIITAVTQHDNSITDFVFAGCREEYGRIASAIGLVMVQLFR